MYSFSYLETVCCSISSSNCCFLTCIQISQEAGQVIWYSHLFQNSPQLIVIHTVKGFGIDNKANRCFSGTLLLFRWSSGCWQFGLWLGFFGGSEDKASACNVGDLGSIPGLGRSPGEGKSYPLLVFWPREFHGQYSPWGHEELDTTKQLSLSLTSLK